MTEQRWVRWVGPGLIGLGAVGSLATGTLGAGQRPWTPGACEGGAAALTEAIRAPGPENVAGLGTAPWFRQDPIIDRSGALAGQRLSVGLDVARSVRTIELSPESFAAGPFGRTILVGSDDGSTSRLEAIDVAAGCKWAIAEELDVIRRATVDPARALVYEVRVDRASRADLGTWTQGLDGDGRAALALPPIDRDDRFGRTFSTELVWSVDRRELAVQSCGEVACRTRVVGPGRHADRELIEPDLGQLVGFDADHLVVYGACRGLPCPIVATDPVTGISQTLAPEAGFAVVAASPNGPRLVHEVIDAGAVRLRSVPFDGASATELGIVPSGLRLSPTPDRAGGAIGLPPAWVLLAPDRRVPIDSASVRPQLRHVTDGETVQLDEVVP